MGPDERDRKRLGGKILDSVTADSTSEIAIDLLEVAVEQLVERLGRDARLRDQLAISQSPRLQRAWRHYMMIVETMRFGSRQPTALS